MGEVDRERDARLERTVAVKVLPAHLSSADARPIVAVTDWTAGLPR